MKTLKRKFAGVLILALIHCFANSAEAAGMPFPAIIPITKPVGSGRVTSLGDGIVVHIWGKWGDGIRIDRNGKTIFNRMINDGHINIIFQKTSADGSHYNVAACHGSQKDLYHAFAIRGDVVFASPQYRNTVKGDISIPAQWIGPNVLEIGGQQPTMLSFDPVDNKWSFTSLRTIRVSHDIQVDLLDNFRKIRIVRRGAKILERMINDGPIGISFQGALESPEHFNFALRYGTDRDVYVAYALLGDRLIESTVYRTRNAETNFGFGVPSEWIAPNVLEIGVNRRARLTFDPKTATWILQERSTKNPGGGFDLTPQVITTLPPGKR